MKTPPDDSPFSVRMREIDDAAPATGLPTVLISWGCLLAACTVVGAVAFAVGPYFMGDANRPRNRGEVNAEFAMEDSKDDAFLRACLGGGLGALLGLGAIARWGREDIKGAWRGRAKK